MPRPETRCRGGRTTPKGTRPEDRSDRPVRFMPTPEESLLRDAAENFGNCADVDEAETMASAMLTLFRPQGLAEEPRMDASRALASARRHSDATAAAGVAAALGAYGPCGQRGQARSLLAKLTANGAAVPDWVGILGEVAPRRAVLLTDAWGDERALWIDFERCDGEIRGIGMHVNATEAGFARGFAYGPATEEVAAVEAVPHVTVREISLADARAMALEGLELRDMSWPPGDDEADDEYASDENMRALIDQRVGLLPAGGASPFGEPPDPDDIDDLFEIFLDEHFGTAPEVVRDGAGWVVDNICRFADAWCDEDPLRWSPGRVALHLIAWIPAKVVCDDESLDAVESVFPRWLRFAAEWRGLDKELLEMNLATARESFSDMRADSADPSKRSQTTNIVADMIADGVDLGDDAAVQAWIAAYNARPRHERY